MTPSHRLITAHPGLLTRTVGLGFFLALVLVEYLAVLRINGGTFVFTLDDPYIHLALAENILQGHYGINLDEFSAPSSSILWPFLIAPVSWSPLGPFLINVLAGIGLVLVYAGALDYSARGTYGTRHECVNSILIILLILCTNTVGLVFIGMEHTLQVLCAALIALGLITENNTGRLVRWLLPVVVVAPLVRYENMAISGAALLYLMDRGYIKPAMLAGMLTALLLALFSFFLHHLGLGFLPTSVTAKLDPLGSRVAPDSFILTLLLNHGERQALIALLSLPILLALIPLTRKAGCSQRRSLLLATVAIVLLHLLAGKTNWYNRYEIYVWTFTLLVLLDTGFTIRRSLSIAIPTGKDLTAVTISISIVLCSVSWPYLRDLTTLPDASSNIFQQQYQMSRFIREIYRKPVAVNDIGYTSYRNHGYVLDLFGLASIEALQFRKARANSEWMERLAQDKQVELAMIYDDWFRRVPDSWTLLGELVLEGRLVTPAADRVSFYATEQGDRPAIQEALMVFSRTLPEGSRFDFK